MRASPGWFGAVVGFGAPVCGGFGAEPDFGAPLACGWFGAEPAFDAPAVSDCFAADLLSISAVSASAPWGRCGPDAPAPERAWPPTLSAGAFARPGPAGPKGAVPLAPGALEAGGGVFWLLVGVVTGRPAWDCAAAGGFGLPVLPGAEPGVGGVFWLPVGVAAGRPAWDSAAAGWFGFPAPGAEPEGDGVFWPPVGVVAGRPAWGCAAAGGFGLPAPPETGAPPAGLGAELGDGVFASEAAPDDGVPWEVVPPALGAAD
ncbi:hypothetical protein ACWESP_11545 [Nocardia beijingensis]